MTARHAAKPVAAACKAHRITNEMRWVVRWVVDQIVYENSQQATFVKATPHAIPRHLDVNAAHQAGLVRVGDWEADGTRRWGLTAAGIAVYNQMTGVVR